LKIFTKFQPKVSIITVVLNDVKHIANSIESVLSQEYPNIEYIIIDGGSSDGTIEIINNYKDNVKIFISEPDKGIYEALNKGIILSNGDYVGILNSGDLYSNSKVVSNFMDKISKRNAEICFSDMVIVDEKTDIVLRYYMASYFKRCLFRTGWMPPHPTCFIKKSLFKEFGLYSTDYKIAGDFDLLVRFFYGRQINWAYLSQVTVRMISGGISNSGIKSKKQISYEIRKSLKSNKIRSSYMLQLIRYLIRLIEIIKKPKHE
jgi:glycosyltransferase involved in cell wall biosynthesis